MRGTGSRDTGEPCGYFDVLVSSLGFFVCVAGPAPRGDADTASLRSADPCSLYQKTRHLATLPLRRRGCEWAGGKAEIGKAESRTRSTEGAAVSGGFFPSASFCSSHPSFLTPPGFAFRPPVSAFSVSASCFVASRAT